MAVSRFRFRAASISWFVASRWDSAAESLRFCFRDWACRAWRVLKRSCRSRAFWAAASLSSLEFAGDIFSFLSISTVVDMVRLVEVEAVVELVSWAGKASSSKDAVDYAITLKTVLR